MKKILMLGLFTFLCLGIYAQTSQTKSSMSRNEQLWSQVKTYEKDDLPQSASKIVDDILKQAIKDKNTPQVIKALIYKNKYKIAIDNQENTQIFSDLEDLLNKTDKIADKALLHSMLAELYLDYFNSNSWEIRQRTAITGYVPDDIKAWSKNIFQDKALSHLSESIKAQPELLKIFAKSYKDIIILGEDSERLSFFLYDFLADRAIEQSSRITSDYENNISFQKALLAKQIQIKDLALPTKDFIKLDFSDDKDLSTLYYYKQYLQSLVDRNINEAIVLTEIRRNNYLSSKSENYRTQYAKVFLENLKKENENHDYNVEIIYELANLYRYSPYLEEDDEDNQKNMEMAYNLLRYGIDKYPNYRRINILKENLSKMEAPYAQIKTQSIYHPDNNSKKFILNYKNLKSATIKITDNKTGNIVETKKLTLNPKTTYSKEEIEFTIDINKIGEYKVEAEYDKKKQTEQKERPLSFRISKLAHFARISGEDQYEFYVLDRMTGTPVPNATITIYTTDWSDKNRTKISSVKTDEKGLSSFDTKRFLSKKNDQRFVYQVSINNDIPSEFESFPYLYNYVSSPSPENKELISIFTDRSIYRPGQTVYFKAVSATQQNSIATVNVNKDYKITLYDVNGQIVSEKNMKTNEFGSLAGEFVLPQKGLMGIHRIQIGNASESFSVEEYKRPTFQVTFDKIVDSYSFGDQVKIKGHAENFSGIKIQGATVEYNIVRSSLLRWRIPSSQPVENGIAITNDDGSFEISFTIPQNDSPRSWINSIYNFTVEASVTDLNGETQNGSYNFAVGNVSMILSTNIPTQLDKDSKNRIQIKATNLNDENIVANGTYSLYSLMPNDSINKEIQTGSFSTESDFDLMTQIKNLPSAKYLLKLKAKDDKGRDVSSENYFILYAFDDKKPPIETNEWLIQKETLFNESKNAEIILGVSANNVPVLYDLIKGNTIIDRQQLVLSNANKKFVIPYKQDYGDNVTVSFTYVINEELYVKTVALTKEEEIKKLNLKFEVFRDKLRPGQQEEWRISIKDKDNKPATVELLASMYDSSLDKLRPENKWHIRQLVKEYQNPSLFNTPAFRTKYSFTNFSSQKYSFEPFKWDYLNWFEFSLNPNIYYSMGSNKSVARIRGTMPLVLAKEESAIAEYGAGNRDAADDTAILAESEVFDSGEADEQKQTDSSPQVRSNFNETAFFYPQLRTNEKGETVISFTIPESNTTWKFRALAHDKSLNTGSLEAMVVSRKELMVTPNIPRFVREGDKTSISTKISNLSDNDVSGKVRIEFFDPLTDETRKMKIENQYQDFSLNQDASQSASWFFDIPSGIDMIGIRIIAESESFSDGEQHVISVLPNKMLVTETMTMNIDGPQTKNFVFDKFINNKSKTSSDYRLTLEYTGNPAWYAIQALPSLSNPTNENAVNWFAAYYVNTIGAGIVKQYPKVNNMIKAWKQQGESKETLVSRLQKNEELKNVLLEETPWVLDAKNESEQMERLSLLFDLNNTNMQTLQAVNKLRDIQNSDGGWSWYKGMYSSRSVTQYILYGFSQLIHLNIAEHSYEVKTMQIDALKYIDSQIRKDFESLKENNKEWSKTTNISTYQLEYLFVRSDYRDIPIDQPTRQAEKFYTSVAEKNWTKLNLYERSLLAAVSRRNGNKELSNKIMASIREYATVNEEMGMFWANNSSRIFMSQSAVAVHTFIMEAFKETGASEKETDMMKQWLLKQKQTQLWESPHATVNAITALLSTGCDWLAGSGNSQIKAGKQSIESQKEELGTGYIKESWTGSQINKELGKVQIQKNDNGPAWGTMYWQYYEELDKITSHNNEFKINKKLFIEKSTDKGKTLVEVTENNPVNIGDKVVVRVIVNVDRDMDFVHLKDMRAACFEPIETLSGLKWQNSVYYYQSTKDASTSFYFDHLPKGTYVFEYPVYANRAGEYNNGITSIQCMYAPEFSSHTEGFKVIVK